MMDLVGAPCRRSLDKVVHDETMMLEKGEPTPSPFFFPLSSRHYRGARLHISGVHDQCRREGVISQPVHPAA
jgi:hypothetical protein